MGKTVARALQEQQIGILMLKSRGRKTVKWKRGKQLLLSKGLDLEKNVTAVSAVE